MILFIIALEPLLNKIRENEVIKPIRLGRNNAVKVLAYADDITILTKTEAFRNIGDYEEASGARIDLDKCEISRTGGKDIYIYMNQKLNELRVDKIKLLGIILSQDHEEMVTANWDRVTNKIEGIIQMHSWRDSCTATKIEITRSQILPLILYKARILKPSDQHMTRIVKKLYKFINPRR